MRRAPLAPLNLTPYQPEPTVWELAQQHAQVVHSKAQTEKKAASHPARASFGAFVEATTGWKLDPWQWTICNRLDAIVRNRETGVRLLVHGPPQFGKSILISQRFPAYVFGYSPTHRLRMACYNQEHSERFGEVLLQILNDPLYAEIFHDVHVPPLRTAAKEWSTKERESLMDGQPSFRALGIRAGLVGLGADTMIIDDPYAGADEAYSDTINANVIRWWSDTVSPRLNPTTNVIVMFHRWRGGDLAGTLEDKGGWELMRFPAIADGLPGDCSGLPVGSPLSPRVPLAFVEAFKRDYPLQFASLYQGLPGDATGNLIRSDWFRNYWDKGDFYVLEKGDGRQEIVKKSSVWVFASVDWASSDLKDSDNTDVTILGMTPRRDLLVLDDEVGREEGPEAVAMVDEKLREHDVQLVLSERNGLGLPMTQSLARRGWTIRGIWQSKDKPVRAQSVAEAYKSGRIYHPGHVPIWLAPFTAELLAFPAGKHDERIDTMGNAVRSLPGVTSVIGDFSPALHVSLDSLPFNPQAFGFCGWAIEPVPAFVCGQVDEGTLNVYCGEVAQTGEGLGSFVQRMAEKLAEAYGRKAQDLPLRHFGSEDFLCDTKNLANSFYTAGMEQGPKFAVGPVRSDQATKDEAIRARCRTLNNGIPAILIDPEAPALATALSGGYAYKVSPQGLPTPEVENNPDKALVEALGNLCIGTQSIRSLPENPLMEHVRRSRAQSPVTRTMSGGRSR